MEKIKILFKTGFFHIFASSVSNKIVLFLSSIVLVRILTKFEYGSFIYAWNIYSIVFLFSGLGVDSGILQLLSEKSGDLKYAERISNYGTRIGLKFNVFLMLILLGIGLFAPLKVQTGRIILCALCILPLFQLLFNLISAYLRAQKRNQEFAKLNVIHTFLSFVVSSVLAFLFREMGMVVGLYVACIIAVLIGYFKYNVRLLSKDAGDIGDDSKPFLKISLISMLNNALSLLLNLLDVFIIGVVISQETIIASYKVATMIPAGLSFIPSSLIIYLYPYFAAHKDDGRWCMNRYKQVLLYFGSFNLVISVVLFLLAPFIIRVFFGEQYLDIEPIFKLMALNYFFAGTFRSLSGNLLVTQRKLKFNLYVAVVASLTTITADFFFIQWWGSKGAAVATILVVLITSILNTTYLIYTFKKKIDVA